MIRMGGRLSLCVRCDKPLSLFLISVCAFVFVGGVYVGFLIRWCILVVQQRTKICERKYENYVPLALQKRVNCKPVETTVIRLSDNLRLFFGSII